jgi:hypothetical protein
LFGEGQGNLTWACTFVRAGLDLGVLRTKVVSVAAVGFARIIKEPWNWSCATR